MLGNVGRKMLFLIFLAAMSITFAIDERLGALQSNNHEFTTKMFSAVGKEKQKENLVMSAFSVLTPLAQLAMAAEGESQNELLVLIGMPDDNDTQAISSLVDDVDSIEGIDLKCASKIYVAEQHELNETFANSTRKNFNTEVENIDFSDNKTADEINSWVSNKTDNKIKNLVDSDSLVADTLALLVNAIYFKGEWRLPFNKNETNEEDFHVNKKNTVKVPMMHQKAEYNYTKDRELKADVIELFYNGDQASMVIVLPHKVNGLRALTKKLKDPNALDRALSNKLKTVVELSLPKFEIETTLDLKELLQKLNVKRVFTPGLAELSNLLKEEAKDLHISEAIQKAFLEVNEEGSEAGAANVFDGATASLYNDAVEFNVNRPFYFEIRVKGLTLFNGIKSE